MILTLNEDFDIIRKASSTVLCNELSKCVYEGHKKDSKRNYKIDDRMICIFKFLYKVRFATKEQINRYLNINGYLSISEKFLNVLNMKYGCISIIDIKNNKTNSRIYVPALGMLYILDKYSNLEINENTDEYNFQQHINNSLINGDQNKIKKGLILTELYLNLIEKCKSEVVYLENRIKVKQFIKDDIDNEYISFKCDLLASFNMKDDIQSYFIKYIDKEYEIRRAVELLNNFNIFVKDEELVDRYCEISYKKPKLVIICEDDDFMQDLFNTIIHYDLDFNNICLSCLDVLFKDNKDELFTVEEVFLDISDYI